MQDGTTTLWTKTKPTATPATIQIGFCAIVDTIIAVDYDRCCIVGEAFINAVVLLCISFNACNLERVFLGVQKRIQAQQERQTVCHNEHAAR